MATELDGFMEEVAGAEATASDAAPADQGAVVAPGSAGDDAGGAAAGVAGADPVAGGAAPAAAAAPEAEERDEVPEDLRGTREALLAERAKRRDWKGQAERAAGELAAKNQELEALRLQLRAPAAPAAGAPAAPAAPAAPLPFPKPPNPIEDPDGYNAYRDRQLLNERLNMSEMLLRESAPAEDVNAKLEAFRKAAEQNPGLRSQFARELHPYRWAYKEGEKLLALAEIGDNPTTYRERIAQEIEAKVRAELEAKYNGGAGGADPAGGDPVAVRIPRSLGTANSAAPRTPVVLEAPAFEDIFKPRPRGRAGAGAGA
jgi:hypothetical protein